MQPSTSKHSASLSIINIAAKTWKCGLPENVYTLFGIFDGKKSDAFSFKERIYTLANISTRLNLHRPEHFRSKDFSLGFEDCEAGESKDGAL